MLALAVFAGFCVVAWALKAGADKLSRHLYGIGLILENMGARQFDNWPTVEELDEYRRRKEVGL